MPGMCYLNTNYKVAHEPVQAILQRCPNTSVNTTMSAMGDPIHVKFNLKGLKNSSDFTVISHMDFVDHDKAKMNVLNLLLLITCIIISWWLTSAP